MDCNFTASIFERIPPTRKQHVLVLRFVLNMFSVQLSMLLCTFLLRQLSCTLHVIIVIELRLYTALITDVLSTIVFYTIGLGLYIVIIIVVLSCTSVFSKRLLSKATRHTPYIANALLACNDYFVTNSLNSGVDPNILRPLSEWMRAKKA